MKVITKVPIILTAFGTTARAFSTYRKMDALFRQAFPHNPMHWTFSRMVKHAVKKEKAADLKDPLETIQMLADQGYAWAVLSRPEFTSDSWKAALATWTMLPVFSATTSKMPWM